MKPWSKNDSYEKENITTIPVWVRFPSLSMHYWGDRCLSMIARMLGKVIRIHNVTHNKDRMQFARVLVELNIKEGFHDMLSFTNEDDELMTVSVQYDWKPQLCCKCIQLGQCKGGLSYGNCEAMGP